MINRKRCFIVAELSANHGGDVEIAVETIRAAKRAGADAIKLQTYTADTITLNSSKECFKINQGTHWDGQYLYDLYRSASLPWEWHPRLFETAKEEGLVCFSSPFDATAVDFLETLENPIYKIASFEITDIPLIKYVASKQKPIIFSTGIATLDDIELAIETCKEVGNDNITLLKCTSQYPAELSDANLLTMKDLKSRFELEVGLSDHTLGVEVPMIAVALGAKIIEKHFILNHSIGGPDAHFSLDEKSFKQMVDSIRLTEKAIGVVDYSMTDKKKKSRQFSRSLFVVEDVEKGELVSSKNIRSVRPGSGIHPQHYDELIGMSFSRDIEKGTPVDWGMFSEQE